MGRLADIVGHIHVVASLSKRCAEDRLPHALLFSGPQGVGKRTVALALASAINCLNRPVSARAGAPSWDACGACVSCRKVDKGLHPDVVYVTLEKTVIPIESIRKLREQAAFRPFEGRRRVFIVDPADRMSSEAQNALLKTLEEPPAGSCIILITSRGMHLLPTTRSRCQRIDFSTLPIAALAKRLSDSHEMSAEAALKAARLSGGRFGAALELDLEELDAQRDAILEVLGRLAETGPRD
ncbi:MAG TPA: DNA polymerase III subunit delta', partial [Candidatus Polarisedimenticolia bacterium]|nr:DNA polymerase III subunit delta' [Candidatus Polarisedimenticolia bacterium]